MSSTTLQFVIFATICACAYASTKGLYESPGRDLEVPNNAADYSEDDDSDQSSTDLAAHESAWNLDWIQNPFTNVRLGDVVRTTAIVGGTIIGVFAFYTFADWTYKTLKGLETRGAETLRIQSEGKGGESVGRKMRTAAEKTQAVLDAVEGLAKKYEN